MSDMWPAGAVSKCASRAPRCFLELQILRTSIVCSIPSPPLSFNLSTHFSHLYHTMNDSSDTRLQLLFDAALQSYEKQTGFKLIDHPLSRQLENCNTVDSVMDILQHQAQSFSSFQENDGKNMRSLRRVVHVLHALSTSSTSGDGIGLVRLTQSSCSSFLMLLLQASPSAKPIFVAFGILLAVSLPTPNSHILLTTTHVLVLQVIKDGSSSHDAIIDLLETIEHFLGRLDIHIGLPLTGDMRKIVVKIMVELLSTIALVTGQIKQSRPCECIHVIYHASFE